MHETIVALKQASSTREFKTILIITIELIFPYYYISLHIALQKLSRYILIYMLKLHFLMLVQINMNSNTNESLMELGS